MKEQQAKALFFAQHLGQNVLCVSLDTTTTELNTSSLNTSLIYSPNNTYLLLRSVNQLTDEEKDKLFKAIGWNYNPKHFSTNDFFVEITGISVVTIVINDERYDINNIGVDYMRSIGILLPFTYIDETGKPVTLSVEEIITKGWAKIV